MEVYLFCLKLNYSKMFSDFPPLHPAIVHFPVSLFLLAGLFGFISLFIKREFWKGLVLKSLIGGIIFSPIAVVTGMIEEQSLEHTEAVHEILQIHKYSGLTILFFFQILVVWYWLRRLLMGNKEYIFWVGCLLLGSALVLFQGYLGGKMVFEEGAGVKSMELPVESSKKNGDGHQHNGEKESMGDQKKEGEMNHENMKDMPENNMEGKEDMHGKTNMKNMNHQNMTGMNMDNPMDTFKFKDNNPAWQKAKKEKNK